MAVKFEDTGLFEFVISGSLCTSSWRENVGTSSFGFPALAFGVPSLSSSASGLEMSYDGGAAFLFSFALSSDFSSSTIFDSIGEA